MVQEIQCISPMGKLATRTWCLPKDTNPYGDIFGGWLLSQMDIAGAVTAARMSSGRVATIAIDNMEFLLPVSVGDTLCCYTEISKVGNTSITINIEAWVTRKDSDEHIKVTDGMFTYVAVDDLGKPRRVAK